MMHAFAQEPVLTTGCMHRHGACGAGLVLAAAHLIGCSARNRVHVWRPSFVPDALCSALTGKKGAPNRAQAFRPGCEQHLHTAVHCWLARCRGLSKAHPRRAQGMNRKLEVLHCSSYWPRHSMHGQTPALQGLPPCKAQPWQCSTQRGAEQPTSAIWSVAGWVFMACPQPSAPRHILGCMSCSLECSRSVS